MPIRRAHEICVWAHVHGRACGTACVAVAQALTARIEAERAVTTNIAHELRTPLAGLLTASSLLTGTTVRPRWSASALYGCGT